MGLSIKTPPSPSKHAVSPFPFTDDRTPLEFVSMSFLPPPHVFGLARCRLFSKQHCSPRTFFLLRMRLRRMCCFLFLRLQHTSSNTSMAVGSRAHLFSPFRLSFFSPRTYTSYIAIIRPSTAGSPYGQTVTVARAGVMPALSFFSLFRGLPSPRTTRSRTTYAPFFHLRQGRRQSQTFPLIVVVLNFFTVSQVGSRFPLLRHFSCAYLSRLNGNVLLFFPLSFIPPSSSCGGPRTVGPYFCRAKYKIFLPLLP